MTPVIAGTSLRNRQNAAQKRGKRRKAEQNCKNFVQEMHLPLFWACYDCGSGPLFHGDEGGYSPLSDAWWRFLPKLDRPRRFCRAAFSFPPDVGWHRAVGWGQIISPDGPENVNGLLGSVARLRSWVGESPSWTLSPVIGLPLDGMPSGGFLLCPLIQLNLCPLQRAVGKGRQSRRRWPRMKTNGSISSRPF